MQIQIIMIIKTVFELGNILASFRSYLNAVKDSDMNCVSASSF